MRTERLSSKNLQSDESIFSKQFRCTLYLSTPQENTFLPLLNVSLQYNIPIGNMDDTKVPRSG